MNIKRYLSLIILVLCVNLIYAQHIRVVAPKHVAVGEEFQVEYTVFTQDVHNFKLGRLSNGIEKVFGPATSSQRSISIVDGHTSSSSSVSFTYVFVATRKGSLSIGPARINVGNQDLASTPVRIEVSGNASVSRVSSGGGYSDYGDDMGSSQSSSPTTITPKDLFIKVSANKHTVYEQEPVLLTYKVYTTKDLRKLLGQMPDLAGFHVQEVQLPQQKTFHKERLNGRTYNCVTWSEYVMYPQMTGSLKIPSITFKGLVHLGEGEFNPFEAFGIDDSEDVQRNIVAPGLTLNVKPLPAKPAGFSGGVGHFNISAQLNKKEVKTGDPISVRVVVSGSGNLKLINQPTIVYPPGFESYDIKVTDKTRLTTKVAEGNMIYDQIIVPRKEGKYTIAPIKFVYFDVAQHRYVTAQTEPLSVNVLKGKNETTASASENNFHAGNDIRPIKSNTATVVTVNGSFFNSAWYWLIIVFLGGCIAAIAYFFKDRFKNSSVDFSLRREKNANKKATSRLNKAYSLMQSGDNIEFYEEISHALWGYVGDKLHIPVGELSRDNVNAQLSKLNLSNGVIDKFISALDECEFERYAPGDERGNMKRTYTMAMEAICAVEEATKPIKKSRQAKMMLLFIGLLFAFSSTAGMAQNKADVDKLYQLGNYTEAAKEYKKLLSKGVSADLYYNLGNTYYKQDSIAAAILSYERALKLAPLDEDIRYNLQFAMSKTIDNIAPESEMFFVTWYRSLVNIFSIDGWALLSILSLLAIIVGMITFIGVKRLGFRRTLTKLLVLPILIFLGSIFFAWQQKQFLVSKSYAIIMTPSAVIRATPDASAKKMYILHEGTKVRIIDNSLNDWCQFELSDGRTGWILKSYIENI